MNAPVFDLGRLWILVLVGHILVDALGHQGVHLGFDPSGAESREVLPRVSIEQQLVVDQCVSGSGRMLVARNLVLWNRGGKIAGSIDNVQHLVAVVMFAMKRHFRSSEARPNLSAA